MRPLAPPLAVLLAWAFPAAAQTTAVAPAETAAPAPEPAERPAGTGEPATAPAETPATPGAPPAGSPETGDETGTTAVDDAPERREEAGTSMADVPPNPPGECPAPAARTIEDRLARSDRGDPSADLDLAACWRLLGHPYPESVALARALARGLDEPAAGAVRARLDALGGPPAATVEPAAADAENAQDDRTTADLGTADLPPDDDALDGSATAAYVLAGTAAAGLIAGTAFGLAALHESSRGERELADDTLELEYGIATAVCLGLGIGAGIAAVVLWPDAATGPAPGPGEVGMGWEVRW